MAPEPSNTLWYGDNLYVLRQHVASESVDLVYLDPPFNSNRTYNVIFRGPEGIGASAQIQAFDDTWRWNDSTNEALTDLMDTAPMQVQNLIDALVHALERNDLTAYLVMMTQRLVELHRVMKPTASLYLHCDPTASHYLKVMLDAIFGPRMFRNEIVWRRTGAHNKSRRYAPIHDTILFYTKTEDYKWRYPKRPYMLGHVLENFIKDENGYRTNYYGNVLTGSGIRGGESGKPWRGFDPTPKNRHWAIPGALVSDLEEVGLDLHGLTQHQKLDLLFELGNITIQPGEAWPIYVRYLRPGDGQAVSDLWAFQPYTEGTVFGNDNEGIDEDVRWLSPRDQERLGYPTQKPVGLLERIIRASSDPEDTVLDPFCGCGTAVVAAEKLGRRWIGIDITSLAIGVIENRLDDLFEYASFAVKGLPESRQDAEDLAERDRYQFQWWAAGRIGAMPQDGREKKGADGGIDGIIPFQDDPTGRRKRCIVSVKSGKNVSVADVRDLLGTVEANRAQAGVLITLGEPTQPMRVQQARAGTYRAANGHDYPKIQIMTVEDILADQLPHLPGQESQIRRRRRIAAQKFEQQRLPIGG